jgi:hypothetical protein
MTHEELEQSAERLKMLIDDALETWPHNHALVLIKALATTVAEISVEVILADLNKAGIHGVRTQ